MPTRLQAQAGITRILLNYSYATKKIVEYAAWEVFRQVYEKAEARNNKPDVYEIVVRTRYLDDPPIGEYTVVELSETHEEETPEQTWHYDSAYDGRL